MSTAFATKITAIPAPPSTGDIFWVDGINGADTNTGRSPLDPVKTIAHALSLCADDHDDYIYVLDCWQQESSWPIVVDKTRVHIIGVANPSGQYPKMTPSDDNPVFQIGATGNWSEIAYFDLGGGNTSPCIDLVNPVGVWIHDCWFGNSLHLGGATPQDGIACPAGLNAATCRIERCHFLGSGGSVGGGISRDGIRVAAGGGTDFQESEVTDCIFQGIPGIAINLTRAMGAKIWNNEFACDENLQGVAITLGGAAAGCLISNNRANFGDTDMGANPYEDGAAAGSNHWMANYKGITLTQPA